MIDMPGGITLHAILRRRRRHRHRRAPDLLLRWLYAIIVVFVLATVLVGVLVYLYVRVLAA